MSCPTQHPQHKLDLYRSPFAGHGGARTNRPNKGSVACLSLLATGSGRENNASFVPINAKHSAARPHPSLASPIPSAQIAID
jgi:hypothetical protein